MNKLHWLTSNPLAYFNIEMQDVHAVNISNPFQNLLNVKPDLTRDNTHSVYFQSAGNDRGLYLNTRKVGVTFITFLSLTDPFNNKRSSNPWDEQLWGGNHPVKVPNRIIERYSMAAYFLLRIPGGFLFVFFLRVKTKKTSRKRSYSKSFIFS